MDKITRQECLTRQIKYIDAKIIYKSNIAIKHNISHNSLIFPELLKG